MPPHADDPMEGIVASAKGIGRADAINDVITLVGDLSNVHHPDPHFLEALFSGLGKLAGGPPNDHTR